MAPKSPIFPPPIAWLPHERRGVTDGRAALGLTGGVASGKSIALRIFAELGAQVLSADTLVHELYERAEMRMAIHARFGDVAIGARGVVDRAALAEIVARDEEEMLALEALVHPRVLHEMNLFIAGAAPGGVVVCEVPLLIEVKAQGMFDLVVTIEAPMEVRRARAAVRLAPELFDHLDGRLAGEAARRAAADAAYANEGSVDDLRVFCEAVYQHARMLAAKELRDVLEGA
ncbi:MAG: dephospho-CoA kinase [Thermoleophilia bacterium]